MGNGRAFLVFSLAGLIDLDSRGTPTSPSDTYAWSIHPHLRHRRIHYRSCAIESSGDSPHSTAPEWSIASIASRGYPSSTRCYVFTPTRGFLKTSPYALELSHFFARWPDDNRAWQ